MHFQFLIEDNSGGVFLQTLMEKVQKEYPNFTFSIKPFRGSGGFRKSGTVNEIRTGKLLNDLAIYLKGFEKSLQGIDAAIFVVLDNDDRITEQFSAQLERVAEENGIAMDHVFCIAVEEMEAWLLGDPAAIRSAYPSAKHQVVQAYEQDSICGTWETLADAVYPGGVKKLKKDSSSYFEIGAMKAEWARNIASHMNWRENLSPSFHFFMKELLQRIPAAA